MWRLVITTPLTGDDDYWQIAADYPQVATGPGTFRITDYTMLDGALMPPDPALIAVRVICHDEATADAIDADANYVTLIPVEEI